MAVEDVSDDETEKRSKLEFLKGVLFGLTPDSGPSKQRVRDAAFSDDEAEVLAVIIEHTVEGKMMLPGIQIILDAADKLRGPSLIRLARLYLKQAYKDRIGD